MPKKRNFSCELALLLGLACSCICISLVAQSALGITTLAVIPMALSSIHPAISFGTWNMIFQVMLLIALMIVQRKLTPSYLLSFGASLALGRAIDGFDVLLQPLPMGMGFRILYFVIGFFGICVGISFFLRCRLPVLPFDEFTRGLVEQFHWPVKYVKTTFDVLNVVVGVALSLIVLGRIDGIGIGTIISAVFTGYFVNRIVIWLDRHCEFVFVIPALSRWGR